jgi:hypothetical protein
MKKRLVFAGAGIVIFVMGFLSGAVWMSNKFIGSLNMSPPDREEMPAIYSEGEALWAYQYFGGQFTSEEKLKPLLAGKGILTHEDHPAAGVRCKLSLNGKFKSPELVTDENGILSVSLPEGAWQLNSMQCSSWKNKPAGDYMLVLPGQRKIGQNQAAFFSALEGKGMPVTVSRNPPKTPQVSLLLNQMVEVVWPERSGTKQGATLKKSAVSWKPYPRATDYVVKVHRVTRKERSSTFMPIMDKKVSGATSLALSRLTHARDASAKEEYAVTVEAYADNGEFLAESRSFDGTFTLKDGNVLVEQLPGILEPEDEGVIEGIYRDRKILDAAEALIKEKLYGQAEEVLKKVTTKELEGKKSLMTGYLAASQGDCTKARAAFGEARKKGEDCIPDEYQKKCK